MPLQHFLPAVAASIGHALRRPRKRRPAIAKTWRNSTARLETADALIESCLLCTKACRSLVSIPFISAHTLGSWKLLTQRKDGSSGTMKSPEDTHSSARRPADIYVPSLSGSPTALDFAISAAGDLGLGRPTGRGRLLSRMPGTSQTINRLRWPVELRGSLLSRWWLKLQAPGTQALQPSSSMWRGLWRPVLVRSRPASLPLAPRALCGCSLPSGQSGLEEAAGGH